MLNLKGIHGTIATRSQIISKEGFRISSGRHGKGVYFWREGNYARDLAIAWWKFDCSRGKYSKDNNQNCSIIYVEIQINKNEYLNTDDFEFKETLINLARRKGIEPSKSKIAALYDYFIALLEEKIEVKYKVLEIRVVTPPEEFCKDYPLALIGVPHCYVVRDTSCITIINIEENQ